MASQSNVMKLLQSLGGMASESYGQGSMAPSGRVGGQPLLPKPTMSMPNALSPYAPGNQNGGPMAGLGGVSSRPTPNKTQGAKWSGMSESSHHPANQLAEYLATQGGMSGPGGRSMGIDAGAFLRGAR
jgi:hypothetical protein